MEVNDTVLVQRLMVRGGPWSCCPCAGGFYRQLPLQLLPLTRNAAATANDRAELGRSCCLRRLQYRRSRHALQCSSMVLASIGRESIDATSDKPLPFIRPFVRQSIPLSRLGGERPVRSSTVDRRVRIKIGARACPLVCPCSSVTTSRQRATRSVIRCIHVGHR